MLFEHGTLSATSGPEGWRDERGRYFPCACTAVMATTPTMSSAVHPRDRSFTGAAMPCRMGPSASAFAKRCTSL